MALTPARAVEREFKMYVASCVDKPMSLRLSALPGPDRAAYKRRLRQLHPSSLPYCGYRHAYEMLTQEEDPEVFFDFSGDYYTGVGTHAHTVFQRWLGLGGRMLGNWKCQACGHLHKLISIPGKCKKCKHPRLTYEEVGGRWGRYLWWHKDGIYQDLRNRLWIVDYKTTTSYGLYQHKKSGTKYPYKENRMQAEAYVVLAEEEYERKIEGWMLFYAARDTPAYAHLPIACSMSSTRKEEVRARLEANDKTFGTVLHLRDNPEHIGRLRKSKLCDSPAFYKEQVHSDFNPCPIKGKCFNSEKSKLVMANAFKGIPIAIKVKEKA